MQAPLKFVEYRKLNPKQKEVYNFQKVASLLADYGYNCIKLADDWKGADFLAYHFDSFSTLRVQLKGRMTVSRNYELKGNDSSEKEIYMTFPIRGIWYLVSHSKLVELVGIHTNWLVTESWQKEGVYSSASPNRELVASLADYCLHPKPNE